MNFSMTPENIGDVYVKLDVIIAGQPKSKFPVMFNLTQFGYQNVSSNNQCFFKKTTCVLFRTLYEK
ncbi:unnamed protein product [Acanthoscelides obtectus]|uniref:Uncharacterized protein n=1 Tax=Acanthoscelides obtectus TaxID=200917 RepID=A0A9P0JI70_ACAOB|nr:unnamed protein product [Acanthoscelides obtectus]CAK1661469.1 hypothetical protein AOBTE_LOCUS22642 [Acanthoscelides obtectus]